MIVNKYMLLITQIIIYLKQIKMINYIANMHKKNINLFVLKTIIIFPMYIEKGGG